MDNPNGFITSISAFASVKGEVCSFGLLVFFRSNGLFTYAALRKATLQTADAPRCELPVLAKGWPFVGGWPMERRVANPPRLKARCLY